MNDDLWLKHRPAATYLDVGERYLYREGDAGRVRRIRIAGGYRYRQSWLDLYLDRLADEQNGTITDAAILTMRKAR